MGCSDGYEALPCRSSMISSSAIRAFSLQQLEKRAIERWFQIWQLVFCVQYQLPVQQTSLKTESDPTPFLEVHRVFH